MPSITTQPASVAVNDGAPFSFTVVAASSAPLSYQWLLNGSVISGQTANTYSVANAVLSNNGQSYSVRVTNSAGMVTSSTAMLTVNAVMPAITTQPVATATVNQNGNITLTVTTSGSQPQTFQWKKSNVNVSGSQFAGAATNSLMINPVGLGDGGSYTVTATNAAGSVTSNASVLTVTQTQFAPSITTQPTSLTRTEGTAATFSVAASGTGTLSYQWSRNGTPISGATNASYTIAQPTIGDNGAVFTAVVTGSVSPAATSNSATLTVNRAPISLVAGLLGGAGVLDETGTAAQFNSPASVTVGSDGTIYVADSFNHTIRKVTPAGVVATFVGKPGVSGYVNGAGILAQFNSPRGIAIDAAGNLYVADRYNHLIRKVTPGGTVSKFAGIQTAGGTDGAGDTVAQFNQPMGVTIDLTVGAEGTLYVADYGGHKIRSIDIFTQVVATVAGTGVSGSTDNANGTSAQFNTPADVRFGTVGANKFLYVADSLNSVIRRIALTGTNAVDTIAGDGLFGYLNNVVGTSARFNQPIGLALDGDGNLLVGDATNNAIRKVDLTSVSTTYTVTTLAGSTAGTPGTTDASGTAARFREPRGIAVHSGQAYVADFGNHEIRKIALSGANPVTTLAGSAGGVGNVDATGTAARFNLPRGIATDTAGNMYVTDTYNGALRKVTAAANAPGVVTTLLASLNNPFGVAATGDGAKVYVADTGSHQILEVTTSGMTVLAGSGTVGSANGTGTAAQFNQPAGLALDEAGNALYVADFGNNIIRKVILTTGVVSTVVDGTASLGGPINVAFRSTGSGNGELFVSETYSYTIRKVDVSGGGATFTVSSFAGTTGTEGSANGTGTVARFRSPRGLAVDASGNVYVADYGNHAIRRITSAAVVTTPVGDPVTPTIGVQLGNLPGALNGPSGIAILPGGKLAVTDATENAVLQITP